MAVPTAFQQLDQRLAHLEREIQTLRQSLAVQGPDELVQQLVERRPDVCGGEPVLVGTRTPVRAIVEHVRLGDEVEDIWPVNCAAWVMRWLQLKRPANAKLTTIAN